MDVLHERILKRQQTLGSDWLGLASGPILFQSIIPHFMPASPHEISLTHPAQIESAVVTYFPDPAMISAVLAAVAPQVKRVTVIDNDGGGWSCPLPENTTIIRQENNRGLGVAYNIAARRARESGATHLLLLDQDSIPAPGMVAALLEAFKQPSPVAAAGPLWHDRRSGEKGFFLCFSRWGTHKLTPGPGQIIPVDFLISSGSLISLDAWADIGPFDETLMIDHVDTDWVLRARARAYRLYGVADAGLDHAFGEIAPAVSSSGRRRLAVYPPERNYYLLRNSIALWRKTYVPWRWILRDARRTVGLMLYYAFCLPPRLVRLRLMVRAVRDGLNLR
jgi:rhamnosyltransferase